jgi:hypothetical protein
MSSTSSSVASSATRPDWHIEPIRNKYNSSLSMLCNRYNDTHKFTVILEQLDLTPMQKDIIRIRYLNILNNFEKRSSRYSYIFFGGHFIITVGSLFVPALLSIQNSDKTYVSSNTYFTVQIYWATFVISLLVTIFNGILTLFKVDKKYYFLNTTLERLRSEGWQYFSLTGRYSGHLIKNTTPSHYNQFIYFTHYIEKIKMKQVAEEYYKADEKMAQTPTATNQSTIDNSSISTELYPPSPDRPLSYMLSGQTVPDPVRNAVNSLIKSSRFIKRPSQQVPQSQPQAQAQAQLPLQKTQLESIREEPYNIDNRKDFDKNKDNDIDIHIDNLDEIVLDMDRNPSNIDKIDTKNNNKQIVNKEKLERDDRQDINNRLRRLELLRNIEMDDILERMVRLERDNKQRQIEKIYSTESINTAERNVRGERGEKRERGERGERGERKEKRERGERKEESEDSDDTDDTADTTDTADTYRRK